ncbi:MAG: VOC family protein [Candidatus Krumholzibacteriia bacterium]|nr:VOC family protein [bacterium]MCB9513921.1 VOC family protein [Candidatus Latescibacterota bacterium]MCB9517078.1 VOC family protein [Candidatus Latescibacterota bacterium]
MAHSNPVVHFEVTAKDGPASREFYAKLFGWQFQLWEGGSDYGLLAAGAEKNAIGGGIGAAPAGMKPYVTFYVMVEDLQASLDRAVHLGGAIVQPPTPIPGMGASALFTDPDGNLIGLFTPAMG